MQVWKERWYGDIPDRFPNFLSLCRVKWILWEVAILVPFIAVLVQQMATEHQLRTRAFGHQAICRQNGRLMASHSCHDHKATIKLFGAILLKVSTPGAGE